MEDDILQDVFIRLIKTTVTRFLVRKDRNGEANAIVTCAASYGLADGSFDYNVANGTIDFRLTASLRENRIGDGLFEFCSDVQTLLSTDITISFLHFERSISMNAFFGSRLKR